MRNLSLLKGAHNIYLKFYVINSKHELAKQQLINMKKDIVIFISSDHTDYVNSVA